MRWLGGVLALAYPLWVFAGLRWLDARWVVLGLIGLVALRALTRRREAAPLAAAPLMLPGLIVGVVALGTLWLDDPQLLLLVPALVSAGLLLAFGQSLWSGPTVIESIARMRVPDLPDAQIRYCRGVTVVWCAFFLVNGGVALWLALAGDVRRWATYTGLISYVLMGALFSAEFLVRSWRFGRYSGTLVEPVLRRLFPRGPAG